MNKYNCKKITEIVNAYNEDKQIQYNDPHLKKWIDLKAINLDLLDNNPNAYRIKSVPEYRPFKNKKECIEEMKKHSPFGWVTDNDFCGLIINLYEDRLYTILERYDYKRALDCLVFLDGSKFGVINE